MFIIQSKIYDIDTKEILIGATALLTDASGKPLLSNGYQVGRTADINGKINLPVNDETAHIKVSYLGYETIIHPADDYRNDDIYLKQKQTDAAGGKEIIVKAKRILGQQNKPTPKKINWIKWIVIGLGGVFVLATILILVKNKD